VTVTDLSVSEAWYTRVFGVGPVLDEDTGPFRHIVYALGNTMFGLHGFPDLHSKDEFDERTPGLDHVSFGCASRAELAEWAARLDALGVAHGEIVGAGYGSGLSFRDPDNIAFRAHHPGPGHVAPGLAALVHPVGLRSGRPAGLTPGLTVTVSATRRRGPG
jgi:glyoxylase I family protein